MTTTMKKKRERGNKEKERRRNKVNLKGKGKRRTGELQKENRKRTNVSKKGFQRDSSQPHICFCFPLGPLGLILASH